MQDVTSKISKTLAEIQDLLLSKNRAYGNSAMDPLRVFSTSAPLEAIAVRCDDKLSRIRNAGGLSQCEVNDIDDLIGYLVLWRVARREPRQSFADEVAEKMAQASPERTPLEKVGAKWVVD